MKKTKTNENMINNMASHYCDILFSWKTNKSPLAVISYNLADVNSKEIIEENKSCEFKRENLLHLIRDEGSDEANDKCVLQLSCLDHDVTRINGLTVISESRTLEISNDTDGYITTVRGNQISKVCDSSKERGKLYICKFIFNESYTDLNVKFLSLGEETSFCLHSLVVNISQCAENKSLYTGGTFDINKLKKDVDAMGDAVSDRARELLTTMEQFKKNKLMNLEDLIPCQQHAIKQPLPSPVQDFSSVMNNMLQAGALKSLFGGKHKEGRDTDGRGLDMYQMLQTVCGSVTSMRAATLSKEQEILNAATSPDSVLDSTSHDADDEKHSVLLDELIAIIDQKINQAKTELQAEFIEFKIEITQQISIATTEMNDKLDKIMCMLKDIQGKKEESPPKSEGEQRSIRMDISNIMEQNSLNCGSKEMVAEDQFNMCTNIT